MLVAQLYKFAENQYIVYLQMDESMVWKLQNKIKIIKRTNKSNKQ